jgi:hypothetical protein
LRLRTWLWLVFVDAMLLCTYRERERAASREAAAFKEALARYVTRYGHPPHGRIPSVPGAVKAGGAASFESGDDGDKP